MKLTPEDVGKKFKTRGGIVAILKSYNDNQLMTDSFRYKFECEDTSWAVTYEGRRLSVFRDDFLDIVERVLSKKERITELEARCERLENRIEKLEREMPETGIHNCSTPETPVTRKYVYVKSGEAKKKGTVLNYCPFCGERIFDHEPE